MSSVGLEGVERRWPDGSFGLRGLDLEVADGELLVVVGPSGCGKSTLLRLLAGLDRPTAGRIRLGERDVTALPPQDRDVAMVFQNYALYPHKTVRQNLLFPLKMRGVARDEAARRVAAAAALLDLGPLLDRKPAQLSGGQRQRVALGRAIVRQPAAFLLDEPLSNLDVALRVRTRAEIARLQRRLGATLLYVTHDQEEAMTLGDRVAVLRDGALQQLAPPLELYRRPVNTFVAQFLGSPAMNLGPCAVEAGRLVAPDFALDAPAPLPAGARLQLGVRPDDLELVADAPDLRRRVDVLEPVGSHLIAHLEGEPPLVAVLPADAAVREGDLIGLDLRRDRLHFFDESGRRLPR